MTDTITLYRVPVVDRYATPGDQFINLGMIVDAETTGTDLANDRIIELCILPFDYDDDGRVFRVHPPFVGLEDPGIPLTDEVKRITGLTDAELAGKSIDDQEAHYWLDRANLIIAHNAAFDRPFIERRVPGIADQAWACSQTQIPWAEDYGANCTKLGCLLQQFGWFIQGHRAEVDCRGLLHLLAEGALGEPMALLLKAARTATVKMLATGAPFAAKDDLRRRGYRWNPGENGSPKAWWKEVAESDLDAEREWLRSKVYFGMADRHQEQMLNAINRFRSA